MKVFQILHNECYWQTPCTSLKEAREMYSQDIEIVEAPDYVFEGWGYVNGEFIKPEPPEGFEYDDETGTFYQIGYQEMAKIQAIKNQLSETDYKAIKYAEGLISEEEYALIKSQRQAWRDEINNLEKIIKNKRQEAESEDEIYTSEQQEL